ncbi:MAG TPA: hypothetical protein PJ988_13065 [Anaerolinea sp.]|nr:hypothetical protein [Anaerolinea sp.]
MNSILRFFTRYRLPMLLATLVVIAGVTALGPLEKTLGAQVRLIYYHGAWVWAGKAAYALAALAGLVGLLLPASRRRLAAWSLAFGRAGLVFWLTYLPLSLLVQQLNWGGIYWDEPRWRIPAAFGVATVLVQLALLLFDLPVLTLAANLVFGVALWTALANTQNVLHPDSPIFSSGSLRIEIFFSGLVLLCLFCMLQVGLWFFKPPAAKS